MSVKLAGLLQHLHMEDFAVRLQTALQQLPADSLPLHLATSQGGIVDESSVTIAVLATRIGSDSIDARLQVFFNEIVGGCNCHDDPSSTPAHCLLALQLDIATAEARFRLLHERDNEQDI